MKFIASTPSKAERPLSGAAAAWAAIPLNLKLATLYAKVEEGLALLLSPGCQCNTASTSLNTPPLTKYVFPPPAPSSAGVPYNLIVPFILLVSIQFLTATAAANDPAPKRL